MANKAAVTAVNKNHSRCCPFLDGDEASLGPSMQLISCIGRSFLDIVRRGINDLHVHIHMQDPYFSPPDIWIDAVTSNSAELHCLSRHSLAGGYSEGLDVMGSIKAAAKLFNIVIVLKLVMKKDVDDGTYEKYSMAFPNSDFHQHKINPPGALANSSVDDPASSLETGGVSLDPNLFYKLFPFHFAIDKDCKLIQIGSKLRDLLGSTVIGSPASALMEVIKPLSIRWSYEAIQGREGLSFILRLKSQGLRVGMELKGQFVVTRFKSSPVLLFMGSPRISNLDHLQTTGLFLTDFPPHDLGLDLTLLGEQLEELEADKNELEHALNAEIDEAYEEIDRLREALSAAIGSGQNSQRSPTIATPADKALKLIDSLLYGETISMEEAVNTRKAIIACGSDIHRPLNIREQLMAKAGMDSEVSKAIAAMFAGNPEAQWDDTMVDEESLEVQRRAPSSIPAPRAQLSLTHAASGFSQMLSSRSRMMSKRAPVRCHTDSFSLTQSMSEMEIHRAVAASLDVLPTRSSSQRMLPNVPLAASRLGSDFHKIFHNPPPETSPAGNSMTMDNYDPDLSDKVESGQVTKKPDSLKAMFEKFKNKLKVLSLGKKTKDSLARPSKDTPSLNQASAQEEKEIEKRTVQISSKSEVIPDQAWRLQGQVLPGPGLDPGSACPSHLRSRRLRRLSSAAPYAAARDACIDAGPIAGGSSRIYKSEMASISRESSRHTFFPSNSQEVDHLSGGVPQRLDLLKSMHRASFLSQHTSASNQDVDVPRPSNDSVDGENPTSIMSSSTDISPSNRLPGSPRTPDIDALQTETVFGHGHGQGHSSRLSPHVSIQQDVLLPDEENVWEMMNQSANMVAGERPPSLSIAEDPPSNPAADALEVQHTFSSPVPEQALYAIKCEVKKDPSDKLNLLLAKVDDWSYDTFALNEVTNSHALSVLGFALIRRTDAFKKYRMDEKKLARFLIRVEAGYKGQHYHCSIHAADVLRTLSVLVTKGGIWKTAHCSEVGMIGSLLAAVVHDYDHRGVNNDFLIKTQDDLAIQYNDRSPMENFHVSATWRLLKEEKHYFLGSLPPKALEFMRKVVIEMVLSTDMKQHFSLNSQFASKVTAFVQSEDERLSQADHSKTAALNPIKVKTQVSCSQVSDNQLGQTANERQPVVGNSMFLHRLKLAYRSNEVPPKQGEAQVGQNLQADQIVHEEPLDYNDLVTIGQSNNTEDSEVVSTNHIQRSASFLKREVSFNLDLAMEDSSPEFGSFSESKTDSPVPSDSQSKGKVGSMPAGSTSCNNLNAGVGLRSPSIAEEAGTHHGATASSSSRPYRSSAPKKRSSFGPKKPASKNPLPAVGNSNYPAARRSFGLAANLDAEKNLATRASDGADLTTRNSFGSPLLRTSTSRPEMANASERKPLELDEEGRTLVMQMALKWADLGHLAGPLSVHLNWVHRLEEEMFLQGDKERAAGLQVSPLMDRLKGSGITKSQTGFFEFVALPMYTTMVQAFPSCLPILEAINKNYEMWSEKEKAAKETQA